MINKNNISTYIRFLYKMKNGGEAPEQLIHKWSSLQENEIHSNLSQLYTHWNFSADKIKETESLFAQSFIKPVSSPPAFIPSPVKAAPAAVKTTATTPKKSFVWPLMLLLIAGMLCCLVYLGYQYYQFQKMHTIYTLTQNVSIRDEQGKTIGNFALLPNSQSKTYTELIALNNDIYPLSIDSSSKKYDFRKVLFQKTGFLSFIKKDYEYGFVNANYVIEDKEQFDEYKRIFGKFQGIDNSRFKLSQRKIIYEILKNSKKFRNSYLLSSCKNSNKKFAGFLSNEIVENTRYQIIAKLEDGYYYSFVGDLNSEAYSEPERIQLDGSDCNADFLFRYLSSESGFKIYNCNGALQNIKCIYDDDKMISSFETEEAPEPDYIQPIFDSIGDAINDIVN
ncbi:MAG: hypothetical protein IT257_07755 [Chitinophagaceae bacterium]|nr:hypothetical protein [Chitinophagaceae bacterium]